MARTRKTDTDKKTAKAAQDAAKQSKEPEQDKDPTQEQETAEQTGAPTQEQTVEIAREQETAETGQDATNAPETQENTEPETHVKTSPEDAARIAAQVEAGNVAKLNMNEKGEIILEEPEPDMFAKLPNPCVYCGPSVKGVARQYTTFQGGIPDALRKFIEEHPEALGLIVSTGRFQAMRRQLEKPGTLEAALYKAVKAGAMGASRK